MGKERSSKREEHSKQGEVGGGIKKQIVPLLTLELIAII